MLPQAEARQKQFEQSAGGKAAYKSVRAVKEERHAGAATRGNDNAADWLS